jgi:hypothetical protein
MSRNKNEMKYNTKILLLAFGFFLYGCSSNTNNVNDDNSNNTSISPPEILSFRLEGNLKVSTNQFDAMKWDEAIELTNKIGDNWRLPTKEEFEILKRNYPTLGTKTTLFKGGYWTSTELDNANAWQSTFEFGYLCEYYSKNNFAQVILVKTE